MDDDYFLRVVCHRRRDELGSIEDVEALMARPQIAIDQQLARRIEDALLALDARLDQLEEMLEEQLET
jgi:hypothetical protein